MDLSLIKFDSKGLVPVIAQNISGGAVLMMAYADSEALSATEKTGFAHFHSRSRAKLWMKGETSGNRMAVTAIRLDCDGDAVLYLCKPEGPTCHTGDVSCFSRSLVDSPIPFGPEILSELETVLRGRMKSADAGSPVQGSYTAKLLSGDPARVRSKISEEAFETILASERNDVSNLADEVADLWFHSLILLLRHGIGPTEVFQKLGERRGKRREPASTQTPAKP